MHALVQRLQLISNDTKLDKSTNINSTKRSVICIIKWEMIGDGRCEARTMFRELGPKSLDLAEDSVLYIFYDFPKNVHVGLPNRK